MTLKLAPPPKPAFFLEGGPVGVLLVHGLTGTPTEMRYLGLGLHRAGYTVYGMRLAGHCAGEAELLRTGWRDWYASVEEAAEQLSRVTDTVVVGGLSMGAVLAMHLAAQRPALVSGLGIYGPTLTYDGWSIPRIARLSFLMPLALRLGFGRARRFVEREPYGIKDESLRKQVAASMFGGDSTAAGLPGNPWPSLAEFQQLVGIVKRETRSIATPALVMHAANDDVASARNAEWIASRLAGPVTKVLLHDSYHMITIDRERRKVVAQTVNFIEGLVADQASPARVVQSSDTRASGA
jgi:carboxylesterase